MSQSKQSKVTPVYVANLDAYDAKYPIICNEGGSRSSKSYSVMQLLVQIAVNKPMTRISCVSHSLPHVKRGIYRDFKVIMQELELWDDNDFSYSDFIYTYRNGSYIELFGLEDEGKARGPGRDILFINEANLLTKPLFDQLAMRTTGQIFLDWNPADFVSWVYTVADNPKNKRIHSTYLNNRTNLTSSQINAIEAFKDLPDDFMWKVYGLGERGAAKELIYTKWGISELPNKGEVFYGLDFGYNHPAALVKVEYYDGVHYVQEMIYQSNLTLTELIRKMQTMGIGNATIWADAAEPKSIEEIFRSGFRGIKAANKDVWAGIVKVKSFPLYLSDSSTNLKREIQSYKWKKDKADNIIEEPVKANDDGMDALRYAIFNYHDAPKFHFIPREQW